ncbi:hypothetical protein CY0110_16027 [Crocosphaera chwakensis CCY0110]|uniref:Uncharacterized protein n=1 Tax=Crocosphaera chwakensis CCY0110 TaxID=391612 RepID=A3IHN7_9CHRO|nr:hypothetical protein CY0110_16027 [Crocosphaera chwakensis CCY0110]
MENLSHKEVPNPDSLVNKLRTPNSR